MAEARRHPSADATNAIDLTVASRIGVGECVGGRVLWVFLAFPSSLLLRYNRHTALCKFKAYSLVT